MRSTRPLDVSLAVEPEFVKKRIAVILGVAAILFASYIYAPYAQNGPVICPTHGLLGLPCPSCGLTRAFCALTRGHILTALGYNAIGIPLYLGMLAAMFISAYELMTHRRVHPFHKALFSYRLAKYWAGVIIIYHIARLAVWWHTGTLFHDYMRTSWTYHLFFRS